MQSGTSNLVYALKALSDPVRLRILETLPTAEEEEGEWNVSRLAGHLKAPQPTVSHHLGILRHAGLVGFRKSCRDVFYWKDRAGLDAVLSELCDQIGGK